MKVEMKDLRSVDEKAGSMVAVKAQPKAVRLAALKGMTKVDR